MFGRAISGLLTVLSPVSPRLPKLPPDILAIEDPRDMWARIHAGGGFVGDFGPALRDLDKRLSKLEGKE